MDGLYNNILNTGKIQICKIFPDGVRTVKVRIGLPHDHVIDKLAFIVFIPLDRNIIALFRKRQMVFLQNFIQLF